MGDSVNHPDHYTHHEGEGAIHCIALIEWMPLNVGNAVKYLWRYRHKHPDKIRLDLEKAAWYIAREIGRAAAVPKVGEPGYVGQGVLWLQQAFPSDELMARAEIGASPLLVRVLRMLRSPRGSAVEEYIRGLRVAEEAIALEIAGLGSGR